MKVIFYIMVFTLMFGTIVCNSEQIFYEDFENGIGNVFTDVFHDADKNKSIVASTDDKHSGNTSVKWTHSNSGAYFFRTPNINTKSGKIEISFWVKMNCSDLYNWTFNIQSPDYKTNYFSIMEGYTWTDNVLWGYLRYVNSDKTYRNLCKINTGWRYFKIIADFNSKTADVFYDDQNTPVMIDLPLNMKNYNGSYVISFTGHSSIGQAPWYLDDIRLIDLPADNASKEAISIDKLILVNGITKVALDKKTGALAEVTYNKNNLVSLSNDLYKFENKNVGYFAYESNDKVIDIKKTPTKIIFTCKNDKLKDIVIVKSYEIANDGTIAKRCEFQNNGNGGFITWFNKVALNEKFKENSNLSGFNFASTLNNGDLTNAYFSSYRVAKNNAYGIGVNRDYINDRFVLPTVSEPDTNGFNIKVYSDYLDKKSSAQIRIIPFSGDFTFYIKYMNTRKEIKALYDFKRPEWVNSLVTDIMYLTNESLNFEKLAYPLYTTTTIWFLNPPWGNWWADSDPPKSLHPDVKGIVPSRLKESPHGKYSAYTNTLFDINSDIYKSGNKDFFVINKQGDIVDSGLPSDSGGVSTFNLQILNPDVRKYWFDMHKDKLTGWRMNFFYMDGPGAYDELQDWKLNKVIQGYDWLEFYKELRQVVVSNTKDGVFFTNGIQPYSDIGYIEWRDNHWKQLASNKNWEYLAKQMLDIKIAEQDGYTTCLTYGGEGAQPAINSYTICYGWLGHLPYEKYLNWHIAALEYRNAKIISDGIINSWWIQEKPEFEAYTLKKDDIVILNSVSHTDPKNVDVSLDIKKLGLIAGKKYYVSTLVMNSPDSNSEKALEIVNYETITMKVNQEISIPLQKPGLLTSVIISPINAIVLNTGAKPCQTGVSNNYGVVIKGDTVTTKYNNAEIFIPNVSKISTTLPSEVFEYKGIKGIKITIPVSGEYKIKL